MFKDLSGFRKENRLQRSKNRLVKPITILWSKSRQLVVMSGTKLMAVGMEKVNLVMIWVLGLWEKEKVQVDLDF